MRARNPRYRKDPAYRMGKTEAAKQRERLYRSFAAYRELLRIRFKIYERRRSIDRHLEIVEGYERELFDLIVERERAQAMWNKEKPQGRVALSGITGASGRAKQ